MLNHGYEYVATRNDDRLSWLGFATMTIPAGQVAASLALAMKEQRQFSDILSAYFFPV
jgi:hypothetical protein